MTTLTRHTVVPLQLNRCRQAVKAACRQQGGLTLDGRPTSTGTLTTRSQRLPVLTSGGSPIDGHIELTPLNANHTSVELTLTERPRRRPFLPKPSTRRLEAQLDAFAAGLQARVPRDRRCAPEPNHANGRTRRRRWPLALGTSVVTVVTASLIASSLLATTTTPVTEDVALERFRGSQDAPAIHDETTDSRKDEQQLRSPDTASAEVEEAADPPDQDPEQDNEAADHTTSTPDQDAPASPSASEHEDHDRDAEGPASADADAAQADAGHAIPEEGVYAYDTEGYEQLDVRGSRREYPATTTVTVTHDDCGYRERWDVAEERWGERRTCVADRRASLERLTTYREFAGQGGKEVFHCSEDAPEDMRRQPVGTTWKSSCSSDGTRLETRVELTAHEPIDVGDDSIDATKIVLDSTMEGDAEGNQRIERWVRIADGLVLKERSQTEAETDGVIGPVTYTEEYEKMLASLEPRR